MMPLSQKRAIFLVFAFTFLWVPELLACSCPPVSPQEMYEGADYIFSAAVSKVEDGDGNTTHSQTRIRFELLETLEGDPSKIEFMIMSRLCGTRVKVGTEYLFFARDYDGQVWTGGCGAQPIVSGSEWEHVFWKTLVEEQKFD